MIRLIETKNFRSLKYISQPLGDFSVLVGANATGKTTFLDVVSFIADLVSNGVDYAITKRSQNYNDLTFAGQGGDIELAIDVEIPEKLRPLVPKEFDRIRFEVRLGLTENTREHTILEERALLLHSIFSYQNLATQMVREEFPEILAITHKIAARDYPTRTTILVRKETGDTNFYPETAKTGDAFWFPPLKLEIKKSALGNVPADATLFPISSWLKEFLSTGVQPFVLDSLHMRNPSPPGQGIHFKPDGSNLPWVIENLKKDDKRFRQWIEHVRTALPDIADIRTIEREEDKKRYIKVRYNSGIEVPSWLVSDGTLRLLALTIPAYIRDLQGVFLIEEPENGIHPKAIETVFLSISSVYSAQILVATHSPVVLSMVEPQQLLCFAKTADGVTDIVLGKDHPKLKDWKGNPNLNVLFASGVLS
ncbi:MAG: methylation-associated defense system AAA family ATPase MAD3 [Saprospiraceae bacterium]